MTVHHLKLDGDLFDAIRKNESCIVPIHTGKVTAIQAGDTIEFLSLRDRQHKLRATVLEIRLHTDMEAEVEVRRLVQWKNADMIHTSRFLTKVLRHAPQTIGIALDAHGWADVDRLIEGVRRSHHLTRALLEDIVRADDKTRFAFNEDQTRIRANHGHSICVDTEPERAVPPEILYHGTAEGKLDVILEEGILPQGRLYVHLAKDRGSAKAVGARHGRPVVLTVRARAMHRDGYSFFRSANGIWLTAAVPVPYLIV